MKNYRKQEGGWPRGGSPGMANWCSWTLAFLTCVTSRPCARLSANADMVHTSGQASARYARLSCPNSPDLPWPPTLLIPACWAALDSSVRQRKDVCRARALSGFCNQVKLGCSLVFQLAWALAVCSLKGRGCI